MYAPMPGMAYYAVPPPLPTTFESCVKLTARQTCFQIPEIVRLIILCFDDDKSESRRTLASAARTCVAFFHPAIDILWRDVEWIGLLYKTLPVDSWTMRPSTINTTGRSVRALVLKRAVHPFEWNRFILYASRVQKMHIGVYKGQDVDPSTIAASWHSRPPAPFVVPGAPTPDGIPTMFPRLRTLVLEDSNLAIGALFDAFIAPGLTEVTIAPKHRAFDPSIQNFLQSFPQRARNVQRLTIHETPETTELQGYNLDNVIHQLPWIQHLRCRHIKLNTLSLGFLGVNALHLRVLTISNTVDELVALLPQGHSAFPVLEYLSIRAKAMQSFKVLFRRCNPAILRVLKVAFEEDQYTPTDLFALFKLMGEKCSPQRLQRLDLDQFEVTDQPTDFIRHTMIKPLLTLTNLSTVNLGFDYGWKLTDDDVHEIARSWPRLRVLSLGMHKEAWTTPEVTLEGLSHFAVHCPSLESLGLGFSPRLPPSVDSKRSLPAHGGACTKMKTLAVSKSRVREYEVDATAMFLSSIFPALEDITCPDDDYETWQKVLEMVVKYSVIRRQERVHWLGMIKALPPTSSSSTSMISTY